MIEARKPFETVALPALGPDTVYRTQYIELLKRAIIGSLYSTGTNDWLTRDTRYDSSLKTFVMRRLVRFLARRSHDVVRRRAYMASKFADGRHWPYTGLSMIGLRRMTNLQTCVEQAIAEELDGDLMECGVWRGGALILMQTMLDMHGITGKRVLGADSFAGLPPRNLKAFPKDALFRDASQQFQLAVSEEEVRINLRLFGLDQDRVVLLKGWFKDTLPDAPVSKLSVLRLDGDLYESTIQIFENLYDKVVPGGFIIVDDYHVWEPCRIATTEFRERVGEAGEIREIDGTGIYWRKSAA